MRDVRILAFSRRGFALAQHLAARLGASAQRCGQPQSLQAWTASAFAGADALIFIGAAGIAVRAIAPYVSSKVTDPAVVVVDEGGRWCIPILSGHLGGANALARELGGILGAAAVITTATDVNGLFSVDDWAREQGLFVCNPGQIRRVSARLLDGETITLHADWPIAGECPAMVRLTKSDPCDVRVTLRHTAGETLSLVPKALVLGVGCRRGVTRSELEDAFSALLERERIPAQAVTLVCSIDRKAEEPGLLSFCQARALPFETRSAAALAQVPGSFSASDFVRDVTGVDNVCERSAVLVSGGRLIVKKQVFSKVTMALAERPVHLRWR